MIKKFKLYKQEDGIAVTWFALSFVVIAFIAGLAIDGGRLYMTKAQLRKTADAAVLSGGQELVNSNSSVENVVNQILIAHNEQDSLKPGGLVTGQNNVRVTLTKDVPLSFMTIFGFNSTPVSVTSVAQISPMSESSGAVPFGIEDTVQLQKNQEYTLKVDSGDSTYGNFGILALSGVGGKLYEDALKYGYDKVLRAEDDTYPGDVVDTQTGNIVQKTIAGVNYRFNLSPYAPGDMNHRDDPRIIKVLRYKPELVTTNQVKSIRITGFAYFYIEQPMSSTDATVKGYFIDFVGKGKGNETTEDSGAYAIKLVE